jgi:hypothetical protein
MLKNAKSLTFCAIGVSALFSLSSCQRTEKAAPSATAEPRNARSLGPANNEHFELDLDGDEKTDQITLVSSGVENDPGAYNRLRLQLSTGMNTELSGLWDPASEADFQWSGNLVQSRSMYIGRFKEAGTLIFLFGENVGCCLQSLEIYRVDPAGVTPYYSQKEFLFLEPFQPPTNTVASIVGVAGRSEMVGASAPDAGEGWTYNPTLVVRLGRKPELDIEASALKTRERLGGYVESDGGHNVLAVTTKTGEKYLWDETAKERIP